VQAGRARAAAELNVLRASQAKIQRALDDLDRNVRSQQAAVDGARQAADAAASAFEQARRREAAALAQVADLRDRAADLALDAYMGRRTSATLEALRTNNLADIARRREYLSLAMGDSSQALDRLRAAREDLLVQRRAAQRAKERTAGRRAAVEARLASFRQAQRLQLQFADKVEAKVETTASQADQLARTDAQLSAEVARQAQASSRSVATSSSISLTTVRGITVSSSIAAQLDKMLGAAEADGITFTGQGYRSPSEQVAVRRKNCGSSDYAVYEMNPSSCHPPTARPGTSMHERGLAIDFIYNGSLISSHSSGGYQWLNAHAATYGFYNLPSEPWHWSVNGT
jgi:LAS superfamily LD-carboxypeptidase LdcB